MILKIGQERILSEKTMLDNSFILNYLPFAPESYVKIYVLTLFEACYGDGQSDCVEEIAKKLSIDPTVVHEAYRYWENQGVLNIINSNPPQIELLPVGKSTPSMHKFSKTKYKDFNDQLHAMFPSRNILPSEYNEYYSFIEDTHMEPNAMLAIIAYCIRLKSESITYPYILAVARNLASQGLLTFDRINEHLSELDAYDVEISPILSALGSKRKTDHEDKRLFIKWTKSFGFTTATVLKVAKTVKRGGMEKLDALLTRYYENHLFTIEEITEYNENKDKLYDLTRKINQIIGVYYEQLDFIIETYTTKWLSNGFTEGALTVIATYCFKHNVRTLEGMNGTVEKFYKQGLITEQSIEDFIQSAVEKDEFIQSVFETAGLSRNITARDRDSFKMWTQGWGMSKELILLAAKKAQGLPNTIPYMNGILSNWYNAKITTVEEAEKTPAPQKESKKDDVTVVKTYTAEQINALFANLDEEDL